MLLPLCLREACLWLSATPFRYTVPAVPRLMGTSARRVMRRATSHHPMRPGSGKARRGLGRLGAILDGPIHIKRSLSSWAYSIE